ncbi:hypothetical protein BC828DRAFT_33494 [Blastocladiella britannica]|nr:hypothetical protein BC828DRAFT_33494 [Blastocladiella britannica]
MVLISPYACHHALKYGCCGKRRWPTASPGRKTKDAARVLRFKKMFGAVFLCQLIFVICLAQGNSQLTRGLAAAIGGVGNVVQTSTTFLAQAKPLVQSLVTPVTTGFGVALDGAVSSTLDLSLIPFTASINSVVGPTTSALVSAASSLAQGNSLVATMVSEQITLSSNLIQLQSQLTALSSASAALNTQHTVSGTGEVYRLTNAITGLPTASSLAIPSTSQATTGVNSVSNSVAAIPGLNALASTLTSQASTIDPQIRAQVSSFTNAFKQTFATTLIPTVNAYLPMLDADVSSSPVGMASNTLLQLYKSSIDASNTINSAESARYFVTLVIGAFFVVSCLGTGLSIVIRSPGAPRRCGCINYCLGIVIFLMGGVFFAVTMAVEMVCSDIAPATSTLPHASPLYFTSSATVGGGSSSANGKSMRALGAMFSSTVATCGTGAAATSPFDALNASYYQVSSAIPMLQDYMPLPTSLTLTGMVKSTVASDEAQLSRSLSSVVSSNGQVYLGTSNTIMSGLVTQVNSAGYSGNLALVNALPSTIDSSGLTTFKSSLTSLRSSLTTSSFTYQSPAYTAAQKQNVLTSFQAQIDGVTAQIDTMVSLASTASSQLAQYRTHASTLTSTLIMFQSQISNANSNYQSIVQAINTLTSSISSSISTKLFPAIDAAESSFADSVNLVIATQWSCQPAGQAVVATVNAMCFTMLPGLDAYWFACVMSGLAAITMFVLGVHLSQAMETEKLMTVVPPGQESQQGKGGEKVVWEMSAIQASAPVTPC